MATSPKKSTTAQDARYLALDATEVERHVADLIAAFPELAEDEQLRADMIEGSTSAFDILERIMLREREANAMADGVDALLADLAARRDRFRRQKDAMRLMAFKIMKAGDLQKVVLPIATVSVTRRAGGVQITDEAAIPRRFLRVKREPDRVAIKAALEAGKKVKGALLGEPTEHLSVRG